MWRTCPVGELAPVSPTHPWHSTTELPRSTWAGLCLHVQHTSIPRHVFSNSALFHVIPDVVQPSLLVYPLLPCLVCLTSSWWYPPLPSLTRTYHLSRFYLKNVVDVGFSPDVFILDVVLLGPASSPSKLMAIFDFPYWVRSCISWHRYSSRSWMRMWNRMVLFSWTLHGTKSRCVYVRARACVRVRAWVGACVCVTYITHLEDYNKDQSCSEHVPVLAGVGVRFGEVAHVATPVAVRRVTIRSIPTSDKAGD